MDSSKGGLPGPVGNGTLEENVGGEKKLGFVYLYTPHETWASTKAGNL